MTPTFSAKDMTVTEGRAALFSSLDRLEPTTPTARMLENWNDPLATPMDRLGQHRLPEMGLLPYDTDTMPVAKRGRRSIAPAMGAVAVGAISLSLTLAAVAGSGASTSSVRPSVPVAQSVIPSPSAAAQAVGVGETGSSSMQSIGGSPGADASVAAGQTAGMALQPVRAYFAGGELVLAGSVPDRQGADALVRRAEAIVGPDAVVDAMVVNADASPPTNVSVHVAERVRFEVGSTAVSADYLDLVNGWKGVLDAFPSTRMVVTGFADDRGPADVNEMLSMARAQGVADWMQARGVGADRFDVRGMGAKAPVASNATAKGRAENRRIQVELVGLLKI